MYKLRREQEFYRKVNAKDLADYNECDFRIFWQGNMMNIVDSLEKKVVRGLLPAGGGWFIDVGCGFGRSLPVVRWSGRRIILIDYALNHLKMAKEYAVALGMTDISFIAADANNLPMRSGSIDNGLSMRLLHHMSKPDKLLGELGRVCATGARMVISYINIRNLLRRLKKGNADVDAKHEELEDHIFYTQPTFFSRLCGDAGWRVVATRGSGFVYQISHDVRPIRTLIERSAIFRFLVNGFGLIFDKTIGRMNLAHVNIALIKNIGTVDRGPDLSKNKELIGILRCPACRAESLENRSAALVCTACGRSYPCEDGIYDFRLA